MVKKIKYSYKTYPGFPKTTELSRDRAEQKCRWEKLWWLLILIGVVLGVYGIPLIVGGILLKRHLKIRYDSVTEEQISASLIEEKASQKRIKKLAEEMRKSKAHQEL